MAYIVDVDAVARLDRDLASISLSDGMCGRGGVVGSRCARQTGTLEGIAKEESVSFLGGGLVGEVVDLGDVGLALG